MTLAMTYLLVRRPRDNLDKNTPCFMSFLHSAASAVNQNAEYTAITMTTPSLWMFVGYAPRVILHGTKKHTFRVMTENKPMYTEEEIVKIISHLVTGHDRHLNGKLIKSIDWLAYSIVFQKVAGTWGIWSQGDFIPMSEDHDKAIELVVQWGLDQGRFNRLIDKINAM